MTFKDYNVLICDYFSVSKNNYFFDWIIPICIILIQVFTCFDILQFDDSYVAQCLTLLGILAGFNIAAISVLTTASSSSIDKLRSIKTKDKYVNNRKITLFQDLYIHISYSIFASFALIVMFIVGLILPIYTLIGSTMQIVMGLISELLIINILFLNIRNITYLYFSFFNNVKKQ